MNELEYSQVKKNQKTKERIVEDSIQRENSFKQNSGDSSILPPCGYTIEQVLGKGVFGEVYYATSSDGKPVALKKLSKSNPKFDWKFVEREIDVGKRLKGHEGIAQLEGYFETMSNIYLVFEYCDGMDLFSLLEARGFTPLEEKEVKRIFREIVDSLLFCHNHSVAHRDIKLDNILILNKTGKTKLIDFGLASLDEVGNRGCQKFVGSPEYSAPEIIKRVPYSGYKADVYSLGMVLFCLLYGQFPYIPEQRFTALTKGLKLPPLEWPDNQMNFPHAVSRTVKDLIKKMLEINPDKRISLQEIINHKWLTTTELEIPPSDSLKITASVEQIQAC